MIRAKISDVDFAAGTIQIFEKKRVRGQRTSRRATLTPFLRTVLQEWLSVHPARAREYQARKRFHSR
jgi:integrase